MNQLFWKKTVFASFATLAALAIRLAFLKDVLGTDHPFSFFSISVGASALYGGFAGGLLAILFSWLEANFALVYQQHSSVLLSSDMILRTGLFLLTSISISAFFELLHRAWTRTAFLEKQLQEKAAVLVLRDQRKDEFLAMLAHELRNPLAPISYALHILKSPFLNKAMQQDAIAVATRQVEHMMRLLNDLLDASRIIHGKISLQQKPIDLCEVIKNALDGSNPLIRERNHTLESHIPTSAIWVNGDTTRLSQLFGNLLNNAAKYTHNGGKIILRAGVTGPVIEVRITDNGIGISESKFPYIFDMFMQVDSSPERSHDGLGIGLMLVKEIAELHGGSVEVFSGGEGKGTEFTVRLPMLESKQDAPELEKDVRRLAQA